MPSKPRKPLSTKKRAGPRRAFPGQSCDAAVVSRIESAIPYPSFARYMDRCLNDPAFGYYGSGNVAFGSSRHFWTYPQRLRPLFGWMVAEVARSLFDALSAAGHIEANMPLTILELGGGDGDLARDTLDYILERAGTRAWSSYATCVRYVIGEPHEPLRRRQRMRLRHYVASGRADIRAIDARHLTWEGPFRGLVVANEMLSSFPCERLRLVAPGSVAHRVHVVPVVDAAWAASAGVIPAERNALPAALSSVVGGERTGINESTFWRLVADGRWAENQEYCTITELQIPLTLGWLEQGDRVGRTPPELLDYLKALEPLVADLNACGLLPVDLHWSPGLPSFTKGVASLLCGTADRCGAALILDYGGTNRHVLDPRTLGHHFRIYGGLRMHDHQPLPYLEPSTHDMTYDIDFTEVARLAAASGLAVPFFGHQRALEAPPVDLWAPAPRQHLIHGRMAEGTDDPSDAAIEAEELVRDFRQAPGFRCLILAEPDLPFDTSRLGESDPVGGPGLRTLCTGITPQNLAATFAQSGLPPEAAACLKPCGDPIADLCDHRLYHLRGPVLELLEHTGSLAEPGMVAAPADQDTD